MNPNQYQISMRPAFEPEAIHVEPFNPISVLLEALGGTPPPSLRLMVSVTVSLTVGTLPCST